MAVSRRASGPLTPVHAVTTALVPVGMDRTRTRTRTRIGPVTLVGFAVRDINANALLDQKLGYDTYIVNVCRMPHQ
jgi:hypothetical protein